MSNDQFLLRYHLHKLIGKLYQHNVYSQSYIILPQFQFLSAEELDELVRQTIEDK